MTTTTEAPPYTVRLATAHYLGDVTYAFKRMLHDLAEHGHDVAPTPHNVAHYSTFVFCDALEADDHGIVLAHTPGGMLVGATFFTPERTPLAMRAKRAIAHGIWVHPEWRRHGLALLMQDVAHARLRDLGYEALVSVVMRDNEAGMASARKAGAEITGYVTTVNLTQGGA